jgi:short-subunit dehydrogenase
MLILSSYFIRSERYGVKASYHQADITNQQSLESAFTDAVKAVGQLHGGLTAAGICIDEPLIEADWNTSRKVLGR